MVEFDQAAVQAWLVGVPGLPAAQWAALARIMAEDEYNGADFIGFTDQTLLHVLKGSGAEEAVPLLLAARDEQLATEEAAAAIAATAAAATAEDWVSKVDPASGRTYHVNKLTKESRWHPPTTAGHDWVSKVDLASGHVYYVNAAAAASVPLPPPRPPSSSAPPPPPPPSAPPPPPPHPDNEANTPETPDPMDERPWSVQRVVQLRHEGLESEVARVKKKAERVGCTIGALCLVVNIYVIIVGIVVGADFWGTDGAFIGAVIAFMPTIIIAMRAWCCIDFDAISAAAWCCKDLMNDQLLRQEAQTLGAGVAQPWFGIIGPQIGLELVAALEGRDYEEAKRAAKREAKRAAETMEAVTQAARAPAARATAAAQERSRNQPEPPPDWGPMAAGPIGHFVDAKPDANSADPDPKLALLRLDPADKIAPAAAQTLIDALNGDREVGTEQNPTRCCLSFVDGP
jgi:hypothetical protein